MTIRRDGQSRWLLMWKNESINPVRDLRWRFINRHATSSIKNTIKSVKPLLQRKLTQKMCNTDIRQDNCLFSLWLISRVQRTKPRDWFHFLYVFHMAWLLNYCVCDIMWLLWSQVTMKKMVWNTWPFYLRKKSPCFPFLSEMDKNFILEECPSTWYSNLMNLDGTHAGSCY